MIHWRSDDHSERFRQRLFTIDVAARSVPGVLWTPSQALGPLALVLIGHGGGGHKRDESRLDLAARYTSRGLAAAAIDGPWHGERAPVGSAPTESYAPPIVDAMVADWRATLDALIALPEIDGACVGYGGVSMGTMFGLPFVAADGRIRAAVLGLCGLQSARGAPLEMGERLAGDARDLSAPVLFLLQWHDDVFAREGSLALFDLIASGDKRLLANPGRHHETPAHARAASVDFLVTQLDAQPV
ncbi:MAG: alpha/beta hydrolase [Chloroflexi bacterium]|nr:alpha/beta hydrolase [Chloroflexota bacterium]MDA1002051.1 alpha/beta hydrolase [Chloroflexota bacterium]MQC27562.1 alpha/beta hydrolase [Chloroflexota bacterium]